MGELNFLHSPHCKVALISRQYCAAPVVPRRFPYWLERADVGSSRKQPDRLVNARHRERCLFYAADLRRDGLPAGDFRFLLTAVPPFLRCVRAARARECFSDAAALAALRILVLTVSGSAAKFTVSSWVALVSVPAA